VRRPTPQGKEDLVQELLLTIHNQRHTYKAKPLTAWTDAIARYKVIDWLAAPSLAP